MSKQVRWTLPLSLALAVWGCGSGSPDEPCPAGTWRDPGDSAAECMPWTECVAGEHVTAMGTATTDQTCAMCPSGTYTSGPNQSTCVEAQACAPGTVQTAAGTATMPATCEACSAGEYCAGGSAEAAQCAEGAWDHDSDPATMCVSQMTCLAGTYVDVEGSATADRACAPCAQGQYSATSNAASCAPWTECAADAVEDVAATSTMDRVCVRDPWTDQLGSANADYANSVRVGGDGSVVVAGDSYGALPGQTAVGEADGFLRKYGADHVAVWTRQFGSTAAELVTSVAIDGVGNIVIAGQTSGTLPGQTSAGGVDAFVRKYDADGAEVWTRQFGSTGDDSASSVSVDTDGAVVVSGDTSGTLPGQTSAGGTDAFVQKYDADGAEVWTRQFGSAGDDSASSATVGNDGSVVVAGQTGASLVQDASAGGADAFVRKYDADGAEVWTRQFGSTGDDSASSVSVGSNGSVVVAGGAGMALPGETALGNGDAFVRKYNSDGAVAWTRQFGTADFDVASSVRVGGDGRVVVGGTTNAALPGHTALGGADGFVWTSDADGVVDWTRQLGSAATDNVASLALDGDGDVFVAGNTNGTLPGQTPSGSFDAFVMQVAAP